jgi:integrase
MLAALRHGEAVNLTWRQLDTTTKPLGRINLGKTKRGVPRGVPVYPRLAKMLATWRLAGWFNTYGRQPMPDDLIVPTSRCVRASRKKRRTRWSAISSCSASECARASE